MANDDYVLGNAADASERDRLGLIERVLDPVSQRHLAMLGIQQGLRCLEVGAGRGSVAWWLAAQVGPHGKVVATDINPRFLTEFELPNVEVRQHDIRTDSIEAGNYDLVHCRVLLMHFTNPLLAVKRMVAALKIGGWLLVEEPDGSSLRAVDLQHPLAEFFNRKTREVYERVAHRSAANLYFGCQVRGLLEEAGLTDVGNEGVALIARGGEHDARRQCLGFQAFVERGLLSQAECAELQKVFSDPSFNYVTTTVFAAWGKRAS
jgi:SAM-dependent methyltransferase